MKLQSVFRNSQSKRRQESDKFRHFLFLTLVFALGCQPPEEKKEEPELLVVQGTDLSSAQLISTDGLSQYKSVLIQVDVPYISQQLEGELFNVKVADKNGKVYFLTQQTIPTLVKLNLSLPIHQTSLYIEVSDDSATTDLYRQELEI